MSGSLRATPKAHGCWSYQQENQDPWQWWWLGVLHADQAPVSLPLATLSGTEHPRVCCIPVPTCP